MLSQRMGDGKSALLVLLFPCVTLQVSLKVDRYGIDTVFVVSNMSYDECNMQGFKVVFCQVYSSVPRTLEDTWYQV